MFADIEQIFQFLISLFTNIANLYTASFILSSVIALWLIRKVISYFRYIMP